MENKVGMGWVYFLFNGGDLIYIGQTMLIKERIIQHRIDKKFDSYRSIQCSSDKLLHYEKRLIRYFKPKLNLPQGGHRANSGRKKVANPKKHTIKVTSEEKEMIEKSRKQKT